MTKIWASISYQNLRQNWSNHQVKRQYLHLRFHATYFLLPWKIPEEISCCSRPSVLFHNLRQYLPYQTYVHTTFCHSSELTRNLMFNGSIYYVLYLQILHAWNWIAILQNPMNSNAFGLYFDVIYSGNW